MCTTVSPATQTTTNNDDSNTIDLSSETFTKRGKQEITFNLHGKENVVIKLETTNQEIIDNIESIKAEINRLSITSLNDFVTKFLKEFYNGQENLDTKISSIENCEFTNCNIIPFAAKDLTFKNCKFNDGTKLCCNAEKLTFDGCTFGNETAIQSTNRDAEVIIMDSQLPESIPSHVKDYKRILQRENALKFVGYFKNLTFQDAKGLIDTELAKIENNGTKSKITFKDALGNDMNGKDVLSLYGGSLIKKGNLPESVYNSQIECKKKIDPSHVSKEDETSYYESKCLVSQSEKMIRAVNNLANLQQMKKEAILEANIIHKEIDSNVSNGDIGEMAGQIENDIIANARKSKLTVASIIKEFKKFHKYFVDNEDDFENSFWRFKKPFKPALKILRKAFKNKE